MKKFLALLLAMMMVLAMFAACTATDDTNDDAAKEDDAVTETKTDLEYVTEKGTLVVGITDFAPMDYKEEGNDEWIGFDADMARGFAEYLGVDVEFVEIDWDNKALELDGKTIDCVWNGMTLTEEVLSAMDCSNPYCNNAQVVIVAADAADDYQDIASCKELNFAVEAGSAGEDMAEQNQFTYTSVKDQATALLEVASGTCDAAIIDSLMAAAMVGEGTGYENLTYTVALNTEEYGVGFRKGSDLVAKINEYFAACIEDGTMDATAENYGVQAALIK